MFCQAQSPTHTQQAITAYLAEVPLPEGWREEAETHNQFDNQPTGYSYLNRDPEHAQGLEDERVSVFASGMKVWPTPAHWPAIPQAVLIRAAVQCHKLREAGR